MTKKDYIKLAKAIAAPQNWIDQGERVRVRIALRIADVCQEENPRFNRALFLEACWRDEKPEEETKT